MSPRVPLLAARLARWRLAFAAGVAVATATLLAHADDPPATAPVTADAGVVTAVDAGVDADVDGGLEPVETNEDAPIGRAANATEAATRGTGHVKVGAEVFAQYSYRNTTDGQGSHAWFHSFDVPRVHGAIDGEWEHAHGRVVLEATRSASEGSLIGVAGDSLVIRVREAYGAWRPIESLEIAAGVVPTLTVPELDGTWMMRAIAPSGLEANGLLSPADLGAKARFTLPRDYGFVATSVVNGEGYNNRDLNRGKTVEGAAEVHPFAESRDARPFGAFASYSLGSTGAGSVRADRLTGGLVWQGARVRAGAFLTYGLGFGQLGKQHSWMFSMFTRVEPVRRVLLGARVDHVVRDADSDPRDAITTLWGTVGYRIVVPLETYLALSKAIATTRAESELPGADAWELRAIMRVVF